MVYAHKVCKVTLSGKMWQGQEEWQTGFFLGFKEADSGVPTQAQADGIAANFRTFFISSQVGISNAYTFEKVKLASIADTGHTIDDEVVYAGPPLPTTGQDASAKLPSQVSLVATLTSARPRGKAAKGRMYLPGIAQLINSSGRLSATQCNGIADTLDVFLQTFYGNTNFPGQLILAAKASGPLNINPPQNDFVTGFKIGDVYDTQRRRRNHLSESYYSRGLAA